MTVDANTYYRKQMEQADVEDDMAYQRKLERYDEYFKDEGSWTEALREIVEENMEEMFKASQRGDYYLMGFLLDDRINSVLWRMAEEDVERECDE